MLMKTCLIFSVFVIISILLAGCPMATQPEITTPPRQQDIPNPSQGEAIAIAKEYCLNSPVNWSEQIAGAMIRRGEMTSRDDKLDCVNRQGKYATFDPF
jgi:hypothetical protein